MRPDLRRRGVTPALLTALGVAVLAGCSSQPESPSQFSAGDGSAAGTAVAVTVECPKVADALPGVRVSNAVRRAVARNLGVLEIQVADANRRLAQTVGAQNAAAAQQAVLTTLTNQRTVTIERIATALSGVTRLPQNLADLAACTLRNGGTVDPAPTGSAAPTANPTGDPTADPTGTAAPTAAPTAGTAPTDAPSGGDTAIPTPPAPDPASTAGAVELTVANAAAKPAPFKNPSATATAAPTATATQAPEATPAASATATGTASPPASATPAGTATATPTPAPTASRLLACPSVADQIVIPRDVRSAVALELGLMELQAATVNARLAGTQSQADQDALLQRLAQERTRNLSRIATLLNRSGGQITGDLNSLAACELNNGVLEDNGDNAGNGGGGAPAPSATPAPADTATPAPTGTATPAGTQAPDGNGSGGNGSGGNGGTGDGSGDAGSGGDVWFEDSGTGY